MKLRSIALAALAATGGAAQAAPAVNVDGANTVRIYMSGASALRNTMAGLVFNDVCGGLTNTTSTVYNMTLPATSTAAPLPTNNFWAITCVLPAAYNGIPAGTAIAYFKSDDGGSGQGVFPVYFETARAMVEPNNLAACTGASVADRQYTGCPSTRQRVPMVGVSDVEPGLFKGVNVPGDDPSYPPAGLSDAQLAELTTVPVVQTVFGVAVNRALYEEMQAAQGIANIGSTADADQPSISKALAASYFAGFLASPADGLGWQLLVRATDPKAATKVNVCRRVNGSGTQASANRQLMEFPCNPVGLTPADGTYSDPPFSSSSLDGVGTTGNLFVYEGSGTGNVINCLNEAQAEGAYAIGHVSKENAPGSGNWRHVKLDGVSPNRENAKRGVYDYVFESTMQYKTSRFSTFTQNERNFISGFITDAALPSSLARLSSTAQQGVAALPGSYAGAFGTGTADEVNFGSRVSRFANSCAPMTVAK